MFVFFFLQLVVLLKKTWIGFDNVICTYFTSLSAYFKLSGMFFGIFLLSVKNLTQNGIIITSISINYVVICPMEFSNFS